MMPNHTVHVSMDPDLEFQALRINMQHRICKWLEWKQTNPSSDWKQRLPDIAKRLEEYTFRESLNKDDYISKFQCGIESHIRNILNQIKQNQVRQQQLHQQQQLQQKNHQQTMAHHNIQSNFSVSGMMIPTPEFNSASIPQVTQQAMPMNSDYNNGSGILGAVQPKKQQQYNTLSGQLGPGMLVNNMQQLMIADSTSNPMQQTSDIKHHS